MLRIYSVMLQVVQEMRPVLVRIERNDRDLARQMRRALASMVLNTGEGSGSSGGTRRERYRNALGSARETQAGLDVATGASAIAVDATSVYWIDPACSAIVCGSIMKLTPK
jgi:four helix bundle protein